MDLGNRLYELRKEKKISQEEAAEKLNVTRQTISKWETNQSQPDFDKIVPICELYGITTDTLFGKTIEHSQKEQTNYQENTFLEIDRTKKNAMVISTSVFLYFIAVIWIILSTNFSWMDEIVAVSLFLFICAIATVILVYHFLSLPKQEESEESREKKNTKKREIEKYDGVIAIFFTAIYLFVSFITNAWHITWLIWIVYALIIEIVHLLLGVKESRNEE